MKISELKVRQGNIEVEGEITKKKEPRTFNNKFGKEEKVCNATLKDASGEISLTLWNEQVDEFQVGDKIKISKGYVNEFQGEKQLTAGRLGKIEKVAA